MKFQSKMPDVSVFTSSIAIVLGALWLATATSAAHAQRATATQPAPRTLQLQPVATGLAHPWAVAFLPGGNFLVAERPGRLRTVSASGQLGPALSGLPSVAASGQGGLLDVVTDRDFARNRRIFFCYAEPGEPTLAGAPTANSTALASATVSDDLRALRDVRVLFSQQPKVASALHFGCRIVQAGDGMLFLALGERSVRKEQAQLLGNHLGKVVRVAPDGGVPAGNPFTKGARPAGTGVQALPEIWSYGHRNPQGAVMDPQGRLWVSEHGPQGGDEINLVQPGRNYGWPTITYGEAYGGGRIGEGTAKAGMEQPLHYWVPSIATSGLAWITSTRYGADWQGSLIAGSLKFGSLHRLAVDAKGKLQREEVLLRGSGERIRDVRQGPDGWLYVLTDSPQGKLLRLE